MSARIRPFSSEQSRLLHKLWMAAQAKRNPLKRPKDRIQGLALLDAVARAMPHYPLNDDFVAQLPAQLRQHFLDWQAQSDGQQGGNNW